MKSILIQLHRWLGVLLFPLFAMIILSGALLALKPILGSLQAPDVLEPVPVEQLIELVEQVAPAGKLRSLQRLDEGEHWRLTGVGDYRLADGERIGAGEDPVAALFKTVKSFHKGLLLGLGWVVEYATWGMLAIILAGLFFGWARFSHTLLGWHHVLGLWLFPLVLLLPATALLMSLHIGQPRLPLQPGAPAVSLVEGLERAAQEHDLSTLISAQPFKRGSLLLRTDSQQLVVSGDQITPMTGTYWPKALHEGTWGGWFSGLVNLLLAGVLFTLSLTGFLSWFRRQKGARSRKVQEGAELLIVHASQTGTAQGLAEATRSALNAAGIAADCGAIGAFSPAQWRHYSQVLVLASTTGEGELPQGARSWVRNLGSGSLEGSHFNLLALGDRRYEHFCGGGKVLRQALLEAGAVEAEPVAEADGDPSAVWRGWLARLADRFGWSLKQNAMSACEPAVTARLEQRTRLDSAEDPNLPASFSLLLRVPDETLFAPGDLIQFQPAPGETPRRYSIGSDSEVTPGSIRLTVSWVHYRDAAGVEQFGQASTQLCRDWPLGSAREVRVIRHGGFHPPADPATPLIMVATGCGIAPFMGFLEQRAAAEDTAGPAWLLCGNRHRSQDYLYQEKLEDYQQSGVLTRLDALFSRDGEAQRYVTERLLEQGDEVLQWLDRGGQLYICGRASTLGRSSEEALLALLQQQRGLSADAAREQLERWSADGVLHRDLFD